MFKRVVVVVALAVMFAPALTPAALAYDARLVQPECGWALDSPREFEPPDPDGLGWPWREWCWDYWGECCWEYECFDTPWGRFCVRFPCWWSD